MAKARSVPDTFTPAWLHNLDKRSAIAMTMRARYDEITSDLGGVDNLGYLQRSLISRYLWAEYWIQTQEQALAEGGEVDIGKLVQANNNLVGLANKLGLQRQAREVSLSDYIQRKGGQQ